MRADTFDSCHSRLVARVLVTPRPLYLVSLLASWPAICLSLWPSLPQSGLITRRHFMEIIPVILCLIYSRGILQDLMSAASAVDLRWWTSHKNNSAPHVCFVLYESWDRPLIRGGTRSNKTFPFWFCNYNKLLFWSGDESRRGETFSDISRTKSHQQYGSLIHYCPRVKSAQFHAKHPF